MDDDSYLSGERWVSQFWLWSFLPIVPYWRIPTVSLCSPCSSLAALVYSWKVCVYGIVGGQGKERRYDREQWFYFISYFSLSFSFYLWTLIFETQKPTIWLFFSGIVMIIFPCGKLCLLWLSKLMGRGLVQYNKKYSGGTGSGGGREIISIMYQNIILLLI